MLLDDLAQFLMDAGSTEQIQKGVIIETPARMVALRDTGGFPPEYVQGGASVLDQPTVQVLIRDTTYPAAMSLARNIYGLLDGAANYVTGGTQKFAFVSAMQPPFFLQRDDNYRFICAFNLHITRQSTVA